MTALLDLARRDIERGRLPACQVAIARDGELIAFESFGEADGETRFHAFSATKPIVASAIWLLIGDGLLDVSRPVCEYVPELATDGMDAVTVEQVLLHTAGFPTAPMDPDRGGKPAGTSSPDGASSGRLAPGSCTTPRRHTGCSRT